MPDGMIMLMQELTHEYHEYACYFTKVIKKGLRHCTKPRVLLMRPSQIEQFLKNRKAYSELFRCLPGVSADAQLCTVT